MGASLVPRYLSENDYFSSQGDVYDRLMNDVNESEQSDSTLRTKEKWKTMQFDLIENVFDGLGNVYLEPHRVGNTLHAIEATCQNGLKEDLKLVELNTLKASCLELYRTALEAAADLISDHGSTIKRLAGGQIESTTVTAEDRHTLKATLQDIRERENRIQELEAVRNNSVTVDSDSDCDFEMSTDF